MIQVSVKGRAWGILFRRGIRSKPGSDRERRRDQGSRRECSRVSMRLCLCLCDRERERERERGRDRKRERREREGERERKREKNYHLNVE